MCQIKKPRTDGQIGSRLTPDDSLAETSEPLRQLFIASIAGVVLATDVYQANDLAVAFVSVVVEAKTLDIRMPVAILIFFQSYNVVALRHSTEGMGDIIHLVCDGIADGCQTNHHRQDGDRHHEHEFSGNYKTCFIVEETCHLGSPLCELIL